MVKKVSDTANVMELPKGVLLGSFSIIRTLGQGGFGVTYLAYDKKNDCEVVVKENMPTSYATRDATSHRVVPGGSSMVETYNWALERFLAEARTLAKLHHPNIVRVLHAFKALGTAYYVMPWVGGKELDKAAPAPAQIDEKWLKPILLELLEALTYLHSNNLLHRDIKPANILLENDTTPILIDFGTARTMVSEHSATMIESAGYTPIEQLQHDGKKGPWCDVYSLGATCYRLITGSKPPRSIDRMGKTDPYTPLADNPALADRFSRGFLAAIDKALALWPEERWQSPLAWQTALAQAEKSKPGKSWARFFKWMSIAAVLVLASLMAIGFKVRRDKERTQQQIAAQEEARLREEQQRRAADEEEQQRIAAEQEAAKQQEEARLAAIRTETDKFISDFLAHQNDYSTPKVWELPAFASRLQENAELEKEIISRADNNNAEAQYLLACMRYYGINCTADKAIGMQWLTKAADGGHAVAQQVLAFFHDRGLTGQMPNQNKAFEYCSKSAEQGYRVGISNLAFYYENGTGTARNSEKAVELYKKAIELGLPVASHNLGKATKKGNGVEQDFEKAYELFSQAAERGCPFGTLAKANCLRIGQGTTADPVTAEDLYRQALAKLRPAVEAGDTDMQFWLAQCYLHGLGVDKDESAAVALLEKVRSQGYAAGICQLGSCYNEGIGIPKDRQKALELYEESAELGYREAMTLSGILCLALAQEEEPNRAEQGIRRLQQALDKGCDTAAFILGKCYENGFGVETDTHKAVEYYRRSADWGNALGMTQLALCYLTSTGVEQNDSLGAELMLKAAKRNHVKAITGMGILYLNGRGVEQNQELAVEYFKKAAEKDDTDAIAELAVCYLEGKGVEKDTQKGIELLKTAAEKGHAAAMNLLGLRYQNGKGVKKNNVEGFRWFKKSAENGNVSAMYNVALCYLQGNGVGKNRNKGKEWMKKAADNGLDEAKKVLNKI